MDFRRQIVPLLREAVVTPRVSARRVLSLDIGTGILWPALVLLAALTTLMLYLGVGIAALMAGSSGGGSGGGEGSVPQPLYFAVQLGLAMVLIAALSQFIGRRFGGVGTFRGALALVVWMFTILLVAQALQIVIMIFAPPLSVFVAFAGAGLNLWLLTGFTAELHRFRSLGAVFAGVIGTFFAVALLLTMVLAPFVISVEGGM